MSIVGYEEIAEMLDVQVKTVRQWRFRGLMPKPAGYMGRSPYWRLVEIRRWAQKRWEPEKILK